MNIAGKLLITTTTILIKITTGGGGNFNNFSNFKHIADITRRVYERVPLEASYKLNRSENSQNYTLSSTNDHFIAPFLFFLPLMTDFYYRFTRIFNF